MLYLHIRAHVVSSDARDFPRKKNNEYIACLHQFEIACA